MKLTRIDVRFYKSFNFDFELKARPNAEREAWEDQEGPWYPFVRIPIDGNVTAIVGANESGKSHLLGAIKSALGVAAIDRADFCRYSEQYSVQVDQLRFPEFGAWLELEADEAPVALAALQGVSRFALFRPGNRPAFLVVDGQRVSISQEYLVVIEARLPGVFEMLTDLAIPDSVSIRRLTGQDRRALQRSQRAELLDGIDASDKGEASLGRLLVGLIFGTETGTTLSRAGQDAEFELARKLLVDAAKIAPASFVELQLGLADGREGYVEGLVGRMNAAIKENLNIQRWWTQDKQFDLLVEAREHEIALTIQDRTASTYSFKERSQGLRFFLSYFVQLTAHRLAGDGSDILLLDEPDAYLSSVGQQDLLRILHDYSKPEDGGQGGQVVYVTHSPFLIDKNAPQRIRVLDKGADEEGTRVVKDAANNRYEPLRSSLGAYVAETAFIGGQNLFVEGAGDQVLLAGLSSHISDREQSTASVLDLNKVTIVGSGGADGVPYMVYLARGRDTVKPACVALLDGDTAGQQAERVLKRGDMRKQRILQDAYIVRIDTWASGRDIHTDWDTTPIEIEDLVPVAIARRAALNNIARFVELSEEDGAKFSVESIQNRAQQKDSLWDAIEDSVAEVFPDEHVEKAGFAREIVKLLDISADLDGADELRRRFSLLLRDLAERLEDAADDEFDERANDQLARHIQGFLRDHPVGTGITKYDAGRVLRQVGLAMPKDAHSDQARLALAEIERNFELEDRAHPRVPRFDEFRNAVAALGQLDRLQYQDDTRVDPSAAVTPAPVESTASSPAPKKNTASTKSS
ncbi:ATP-binding protein [Frigoribacterium sp. PhB24]|uniref:ATP-binding protein n=1 Tax=Frigoribacterium sp. PhB24 TaxID=2485204 RepID=UPI000F4A7BA9|nr:ATP-binding protein [Frigoribacterium sp. PhB24]ROS54177.1 putative ATP-dependent endonuclease of OLD family [Frigoribacterium sp. PhB24]